MRMIQAGFFALAVALGSLLALVRTEQHERRLPHTQPTAVDTPAEVSVDDYELAHTQLRTWQPLFPRGDAWRRAVDQDLPFALEWQTRHDLGEYTGRLKNKTPQKIVRVSLTNSGTLWATSAEALRDGWVVQLAEGGTVGLSKAEVQSTEDIDRDTYFAEKLRNDAKHIATDSPAQLLRGLELAWWARDLAEWNRFVAEFIDCDGPRYLTTKLELPALQTLLALHFSTNSTESSATHPGGGDAGEVAPGGNGTETTPGRTDDRTDDDNSGGTRREPESALVKAVPPPPQTLEELERELRRLRTKLKTVGGQHREQLEQRVQLYIESCHDLLEREGTESGRKLLQEVLLQMLEGSEN